MDAWTVSQLEVLMSHPASWEVISGLLLGMTLSATCGLRVFVAPLCLSAAALFLGFDLPAEIHWLGSFPALFLLLTATLVEVAAYYVPWLDNALDGLAGPAAMVAGTVLTQAFLGEQLDPLWQWSIALIAGGGAAGLVQSATASSRAASSMFTLGLANPVLATAELMLSLVLAATSLILPVVALVVGTLMGLLVLGVIVLMVIRLFRGKKSEPPNAQPA